MKEDEGRKEGTYANGPMLMMTSIMAPKTPAGSSSGMMPAAMMPTL
jgi:hypothetical protein